jgi:SecD/SecF fusion protein
MLSIPSFIPNGRLPAWYPQPHVNLGLDLQGGSYLLLELDRAALLHERLESVREQAAVALRRANVAATSKVTGDRVLIEAANPDAAAKAISTVVAEFGADSAGRPALQVTYVPDGLAIAYTDAGKTSLLSKAVDQSTAIVRRRIDETGTNEPVVAKQGEARILVELPGVNDPGRLRTLLGSTAKMTFHLVANEADADLPASTAFRWLAMPTSKSPFSNMSTSTALTSPTR